MSDDELSERLAELSEREHLTVEESDLCFLAAQVIAAKARRKERLLSATRTLLDKVNGL